MNVDRCERTYKWVMMIKNWFFQINPLQKTQGLPFPSPQKHEQQRYTELSLATISLVSLLSFLAHTSVCFTQMGMIYTLSSTTVHLHLITNLVMWFRINVKRKKNPEAKDYGFHPLLKFVLFGAKPNADWIFWAWALTGPWEVKVPLRARAAAERLFLHCAFCYGSHKRIFFHIFSRTFWANDHPV